jgi:hypothetical protein
LPRIFSGTAQSGLPQKMPSFNRFARIMPQMSRRDLPKLDCEANPERDFCNACGKVRASITL